MSRLLRYVVEKTLAGEADQLKEYAVGMEVFDRDDKYDPRLDSIVRVEAGRLAQPARGVLQRRRRQLTGSHQPAAGRLCGAVRVPNRHARAGAGGAPGSRTQTPHLDCVAFDGRTDLRRRGNGGLARRMEPYAPKAGPAIAVLAFNQYSPSAADAAVAAQLTESVTSELARLGTVGVASHTSAMQFAGTRTPLGEIASTLNVHYVLEADVEHEANGLLVVLRLVNTATNRKVWVSDYRGAADDARGISQRIAFDVSAELLRRAAHE